MLLLTGNKSIGYLTSLISPFLLVTSIWFWVDLNEEFSDLPIWKPLPCVVKTWRWIMTFFGGIYIAVSIYSISCFQSVNGQYCDAWKEAPQNLHQLAKYLFNFLFGANWTEPLAAFIGYLALIAYFVGIIQWLLIRLPKQGRIAGGF